MARLRQQIDVDRQGDVFCVRLRHRNMAEEELYQFSDDIVALIQEDGCRKMVLNLGPEPPLCLYSIFLAKLVSIQRRLVGLGGALRLAHVEPETQKIFAACKLQTLFHFSPDMATAVAELS